MEDGCFGTTGNWGSRLSVALIPAVGPEPLGVVATVVLLPAPRFASVGEQG